MTLEFFPKSSSALLPSSWLLQSEYRPQAGGLLSEAPSKGTLEPALHLTKAGLRYVRIHDLRHTFASLLLQNGESLVYVKDQMGHTSIKITIDIYGHLVPGGNKAAVDRLDGLENTTIRNPDATLSSDAVLEEQPTHGNITEKRVQQRGCLFDLLSHC
jgi:hypothetical protein